MKQYFKTQLLKLAKWIVKKFESETFKNIEFIEKFTVKTITRNFLLSGRELEYSNIPNVLFHDAHQKCVQDLVNELIANNAIKVEVTEDLRTGDRHYHAQIRVLFPKQ